jgi:hypothetical protein
LKLKRQLSREEPELTKVQVEISVDLVLEAQLRQEAVDGHSEHLGDSRQGASRRRVSAALILAQRIGSQKRLGGEVALRHPASQANLPDQGTYSLVESLRRPISS